MLLFALQLQSVEVILGLQLKPKLISIIYHQTHINTSNSYPWNENGLLKNFSSALLVHFQYRVLIIQIICPAFLRIECTTSVFPSQ